ncbi:MAG: ABC transporter substrate-binding protein [Desulfobacterales bacterium]|nr:ABC transporter substrate-binding protein [Desulfobacterales bacterium]
MTKLGATIKAVCIHSILIGLIPGIVLGLLLLTPVQAETASPKVQLESTIQSILTVLRDPALKSDTRQEEKREKLRSIARQRFDYRKMSQLSLGRHWRDRSEVEKASFTKLFGNLLEDTYMDKIDDYTDEHVAFVNERLTKKKAQVDTKIITKDLEIPINYRMYRKKDGRWMIYDMVIEGVSMIGNYRSQFGQILERQSFDELVEKLRNK